MLAEGLCSSMNLKSAKASINKSDPSTLGIVFMAVLCAFLPLDISQLSFAILGAVLYALIYKSDQGTAKKKAVSVSAASRPYNAIARGPKAKPQQPRPVPSLGSTQVKVAPPPVVNPEVRAPSIQPIVAPTFHSNSWDGEIQELLQQITPTPEVEQIVHQLAKNIQKTIESIIPEIEVHGFANGNFTFGKAFGVAVPEVDIVASINYRALFHSLHSRSTQCSASQIDEKKLQKSAIRACTDRLVSAGGFKFRRSAFRGQEPKVTLLAPASLGLFSDSIPIDFSINVVTPLYNAALLTDCSKMNGRAKELILLVRRWAKDRGICHAPKGHLSPYMWSLLSIYFMQVGIADEDPLVPPLEQFEMSSKILKGKNATSHTTKQPKWIAQTDKTTGALFKEFVHFFAARFDWSNEAVSIRSARRAPPSSDLPLHIILSENPAMSEVGPSIEDPFHAGQNLGDGVTAASLARLKEELSRAEALCMRGASLSELLEPWAPPEAAEPRDDEDLPESAAGKLPEAKTATKPPSAAPPWRRPAAARAVSSSEH